MSSLGEGWRWGQDGHHMHLVGRSHYSTLTSLGTDRLQINLAFNSLDFIICPPSVSFSLCVPVVYLPFFSETFEYLKICGLFMSNCCQANLVLMKHYFL